MSIKLSLLNQQRHIIYTHFSLLKKYALYKTPNYSSFWYFYIFFRQERYICKKTRKIESELVGLTILLMIVKYAAFFEFRRLAAPIIPVAFWVVGFWAKRWGRLILLKSGPVDRMRPFALIYCQDWAKYEMWIREDGNCHSFRLRYQWVMCPAYFAEKSSGSYH